MWIDDDVLANVPDTEPTRGRPRLSSDVLIQALLGLKAVFHLPLRAQQGFAQSLRDLAFAELPVANYMTVCRRALTLQVELPVIDSDEPPHLVVDSTGAKVYGGGEWKIRQHGYSKRRTWRRTHLALNANTGQLRAALMTHQDVVDGEVLPELLDQIPTDEPSDTIGGDGAYDTQACYAEIAARDAMPSIPRLAKVQFTGRHRARRSSAQRSCRREWKQQSGYHRRSLAENAMSWLKTLMGPCLWAIPRRPTLPFKWACSTAWPNSPACNLSASREFMNKDTTSSPRLIYATMPPISVILQQLLNVQS
ncbi:IS5 family transposase [Burkholderia cenocepacia]|uniref:IS5 family transposase n=1 Tax=Burkholderia cenocepacia TaxID=95486 RepID=UPI0035DD1D24